MAVTALLYALPGDAAIAPLFDVPVTIPRVVVREGPP